MKKLLLILLCVPLIGLGQETGCISGDCDNGVGTYVLFWKSEIGEWRNDVFLYDETTYKYVGEYKDGKKNGQGTKTFTTLDVDGIISEIKYIGEWVDGELIKGAVISDNYKYEGEIANSKPHGLGEGTYYSDGRKEEGLFSGGVFFGGCSEYYGSNCNNGEGTFIYPNGSRYIGNWKGGKRHGQGTIVAYSGLKDNKWTFNDESKYTGEWKDGKRYSLEHRIKAFVEQKVNEWQQKGEFEKTTVYLERVNEINRNAKIKEFQGAAMESLKLDFLNSIDFSNIELGDYDADNETFLLKDKKLGDLVISVPISEAKELKENFSCYNFFNPECEIIDDKFVLSYVELSPDKNQIPERASWNTVMQKRKLYQYPEEEWASLQRQKNYASDQLKRLEITVEQDKKYTYSLDNTQDYAITEIDYEFSSIEIDEVKSSKKAKSSRISTNKLKVGTSSVNINIPSNKKVKNRYALVIGNEDYTSFQRTLSSEQNVDYAVNDASTFKKYCLKTLGVKADNMNFLTNATAGAMKRKINKMLKLMNKLGDEAELIFYYAGHGYPDETTKVPYLIPVDVSGTDLSYAIKLEDLYRDLGNTNARVTVFLDACFTGGGRNSGLMASRGVKVKPKEGSLSGNLVVFSASSGNQSALPYHKKDTECLLIIF